MQNVDAKPSLFLVDAHVHFHGCFGEEQFLVSAASNFAAAAARLDGGAHRLGMLMMTESSGAAWFDRLSAKAHGRVSGDGGPGEWRVAATAERESLIASSPDGDRLVIVGGRQVVTSERLEVLWLGSLEGPEDGRPIREVIAAAHESGAIAVLPWGFGKWTGRRRRIMQGVLADAALAHSFHFGDNAGRPLFWPTPRWFRGAGLAGRRVLPGSDPLPFADQVSRPGSFGFYGYGDLGSQTPWRRLKQLIDDPATKLARYGRPEVLTRFVRNQIAMQWRRKPIRSAVA